MNINNATHLFIRIDLFKNTLKTLFINAMTQNTFFYNDHVFNFLIIEFLHSQGDATVLIP